MQGKIPVEWLYF